MLDIRRIDPTIAVAPQIAPEDMAAIRAAGFSTVVNNRPDEEEPGQPSDAALRAAAEAEGLQYRAIPITHAGFDHPQLDAMTAALAEAGGPVLAFCRSGTRSCNLWALARAKAGVDSATLVAAASGAGYDLSNIAPTLDALAGQR